MDVFFFFFVNMEKVREIIEIISRREPYVRGFCRRLIENIESLTSESVYRKLKFLLGYSTLSTIALLHRKNLLSREMILFLGRCLRKRKQENRKIVSKLMFDYKCYQGKLFNFFFKMLLARLLFKFSKKKFKHSRKWKMKTGTIYFYR